MVGGGLQFVQRVNDYFLPSAAAPPLDHEMNSLDLFANLHIGLCFMQYGYLEKWDTVSDGFP